MFLAPQEQFHPGPATPVLGCPRTAGIAHVKGGSTTIASVVHTLDTVGNRTHRVDRQGTHSYSNDNVYRLASVPNRGPSTVSYAFDNRRKTATATARFPVARTP